MPQDLRKKLRLLVVGVSWPPETFIARLVLGLAMAGVEVTVVCNRRPTGSESLHPNLRWKVALGWEGNISTRAARLSRMTVQTALSNPRHLGAVWLQAKRIPDKIGRLRLAYQLLPFANCHWDVLYFPWNSAAISYMPLLEIFQGPVVISCRGSQINIAPHSPSRSALMRAGLRATFARASAVHCVSSAIKEEAVSYGLEHAKAWVIHPAVDANFFFPSPATLQVASNHDINMIKLITVGSLVWTKGYEYALTSIRRLVDEGLSVSLDIIGDGPDRQRVLYTIRDMHLESEVRLLGKLAPGRVRDHLQQSDIFVLSSLSEGLSNAVLEAMACGLPVVSTDCGGMSEAITEGIEGFLVPVRQPTAMAKRISDLARDAGLRSQMGRAGRMQVLNKFGQQSQVDRFVAMFCSCVGLPEPQTCTHHQ